MRLYIQEHAEDLSDYRKAVHAPDQMLKTTVLPDMKA